jgi:phosphomannomutase
MATPLKFGTDGWRAIIGRDFTYDNLARVTQAAGLWLKQQTVNLSQSGQPQVMLGYDCRFEGATFARAVANQLAQQGIKVFLSPGFVSTPMVSLATLQRQCTAGIILTASHNPPSYNGFKIKAHYGGPASPSMITAVEALIPDATPAVADRFNELVDSRQIEYYDMEALYINHVRMSFDLDAIKKSGLAIGYDAMFGAGQTVMHKLFPKSEFPNTYFLHAEFNPSFLGQAPEPIERNLGSFQELVRSKKIPFGLATDGDADRIGLFDDRGVFIDSHHILLLLVHYLGKVKGMKGKVVYTFSCTSKIAVLCEAYGIPYEYTKIGFKYIAEIMTQEPVLVGGEESGGIAVMGHAPERDGIYIGLMLLEAMAKTGKTLKQLIDEVYAVTGPFAVERNDLHLTEEQKQAVLKKAKGGGWSSFGPFKVMKEEDLDGYKYHLQQHSNPIGWVLIRPSGTEPVLRVYAEAPDRTIAEMILSAVQGEILT